MVQVVVSVGQPFAGLRFTNSQMGFTMKTRVAISLVVVFFLASSFANAQEGKVNSGEAPEKKAPDAGAIQQAAIGYQLALLGDKNKSSNMLLAAAELLGGMKQSPRDVELNKQASESESGDKSPHNMSFGSMLDRAIEYASEDAKNHVKSQVDKLRTGKGLTWSDGKDLESVNVGGKTFKIIDHDVIKPGQTCTYTDLDFEGGEHAKIVVIGDGDGDLDLWVFDGAGKKSLMDKDTDGTSRCVADWNPKWDGPFTARVKNVGRVAEEYLIIANW